MALSSATWDDHLLPNLRKVMNAEPKEQAFAGSPALTMFEKRPVSLQGNYIQAHVSYVGSAKGGAYTENSSLSTEDVKSALVAEYTPAFYAEPVRMSHIDEKRCGGSQKLFDLWAFKVKQAKMRLRTKIATDMFATSQASNGINPLPLIIPADNTTVSYGNLDRATYTWWRNYSATAVGAWTSNGTDALDLLELNIQVDGGRGPDWYVTTKAIFQKMKKTARTFDNFDSYTGKYAEKLADAGIQAINFNGKPIIWDPYCPSGYLYAIRNDALYLGLYEDFDLSPIVRLEGSGVQGKVMYVRWAGQFVCEEQRRLGQLSGLS